MLSILCCSNDEQVLSQVLEPGLRDQEPHQFLLWRNTAETNLPLPVVYNRLVREADGERLLFVHQDVRLLPGALLRLGEKLDRLEGAVGPIGVFGLAGASAGGWLHNGTCGPSSYRGVHVQVQTLDECLFGCHHELLAEVGGFSETDALAWHGYAVDLCVRMAALGRANHVVQMLARHEGPHHASNLHVSTLREAQAHVARCARIPVATSGGTLKLVPRGDMNRALQLALAGNQGTGHARRPQDHWHARTDCRSEVTDATSRLLAGDGTEGADREQEHC